MARADAWSYRGSHAELPASIQDDYGLGFSTGGGGFGRGGAPATNRHVDRKRGLITILLVQHAGFPGDGGKSQGAFRQAAEKIYGK